DFACGLPLGFASLTPANRLKFESSRAHHFPLLPLHREVLRLRLRISPAGYRSALPRSRPQTGSSSNPAALTIFPSCLSIERSFAFGSGFRLRAPARLCLAHARKPAQVRIQPRSPFSPLASPSRDP